MTTLPDQPRDIIARRELNSRLIAARPSNDPASRRQVILPLLTGALHDGEAELHRRFAAGASGSALVSGRAYLIDQLLRLIFDDCERLFPASNPTSAERLALIALGGYGRRMLAPYSDIDLLFLLPYKQTPRGEQIIEQMLYTLWDLRLKIGHATRSIDECISFAKRDWSIATALLEARHVWGEPDLFATLKYRYQNEIQAELAAAFIEAKLDERNVRHLRLGDSRYVLEPNIKDGKGGLRDLQTLYWLVKFVYMLETTEEMVTEKILTQEEAARFAKAENFLWSVRWLLHQRAGRADEILTFDAQTELAAMLHYTDHAGSRGVERFMKHYFLNAKTVGDLTRIVCANLEAEHQRPPRRSLRSLKWGLKPSRYGFTLIRGRMAISAADKFLADPVNLIRLFWAAHHYDSDIHPAALRLITQNLRSVDVTVRKDGEANRLFVELLTAKNKPDIALRRMNDAGLLGRFIPDFGRVVGQMQYDMYHVYTVDEHSLFAIGTLAAIEAGTLAETMALPTKVMPRIKHRRALFLAVLVHDIAKGKGGDHSILGAAIALKLGARFGFDQDECAVAAWLVRHHLIMSNTAFRRDISDPETVARFTALVGSQERLDLLTILTAADISAVGPGVWTSWKANLLAQLHEAATIALRPKLPAQAQIEQPAIVLDLAAALGWPNSEFNAFITLFPPSYWHGQELPNLIRHAQLIGRAEAEAAPLALDSFIDVRRGVTEVTVYTDDQPGLFAKIAGALTMSGANIVAAQIFTLKNGKALDRFSLQDHQGQAFTRADRLARFAVLIEQALNGNLAGVAELNLAGHFGKRPELFAVKPRILIDNEASQNYTLIELSGADRPGLLYEICTKLTVLQLKITSARIATYGERAIDVFYVRDDNDEKLWQPDCQAALYHALLMVLRPPASNLPASDETPCVINRTIEPVR